ncbi:X2-like carbohydrate binding domain-containing protein [Paenibacillus athensensis]|nr:X2-like carbohydrate binding domain-containing protein [Paenibacillus athensensis]
MRRSKFFRFVILGLVVLLCIPLSGQQAEAADYTHGVDVAGTAATIWLQPEVSMLWVDVHYNLNSGAQQNIRMTYNSSLTRYEQPLTVADHDVVNYSFTYFDGANAIDTPWYQATASSSVSKPVIWPGSSGTYNGSATVAITTSTSGAELYYTTDGSTPTSSSTRYWGPFTITQSTTIQAIGVKTGLNPSAVASAAYTICTSSCLTDHGVEMAGTTATVWFQYSQSLIWTDLHYNINSGGQQNVRMTYNSSKARYEQDVSLTAGDVLDFKFTYFDGASATDTAGYVYTFASDSQISPANAAFDKMTAAQADIGVTLTLNGNTFTGIGNGASVLTAGSDYAVDATGTMVTVRKAYLATLANGTATLVFKFSGGADQSLSVTITDTTPLDSQISPTTAAFDKKVSAQADVPVTLTLNGNTFSGVWNGAAALTAGTDYTVAGNVVTVQKAYLASLANGTATLVFKFSAGTDQSLSVTITDTTPLDSQISPTTAAFDKKVSAQADVPVTLTLNGNTFSGVWNGAAALTAGTDYTVAGNVVTLQKAYLATLANGTATLVFKFNAGADQSLSVTITDTTPSDSQISPTTAAFDKKVSAQADVPVTLTLNGNTFSGVWNGAAALTAGTDYTVAGNVVTLQKAYLASLANGTATLVLKFSAGADQSLSVTITDTTPLDSQISPTTAAFDKKVSAQADVPVTLTLNGNTFSGVWNGAAALTAGTDYTVAGNVVTLQKAYLATLANGTATLVFKFSGGADQSLSVTITDTTPLDSQISPTTAAFDKKVSAQANVPVTLTLNGNTFSGVWNGAASLTAGTDYTVAGNVVTLQKAYLASLANGSVTLVFKFSAGADQSLSVTITDTTPLDSQISPTTAAFDKKVSAQADVPVTLTLNGNTFSGVWNGASALTAGTDYTVSGNVVTLQKAYLATLSNGTATLVFKFSAGADQSLSVTITDTTPSDSQISPTTAAFDKKVSAQADVPITLTLNGNTFSGVWNGAAALTAGTDYTVAGNVVTLQKAYLATLANGTATLVFKFSGGADQSLSVTITDTTPLDSQISPTTAAFDKKVSAQADVPVTLTLNGNTFSGVWNGAAALTAGTDYTVAGNVVTLQKAYLAGLGNGSVTLVFKFNAGADQNLSVTITDTTPSDSQISPTTAAFDKKASAQADVPVTLTLNGNTFSGVWNGASPLTAGTDYSVAGNVVTLQKTYLASLANGTATLVFKFNAGADQSLSMTITDTTPSDSQISPTTAAFDKKASAQADVPVTLTLNGNTFSGVWNGAASLTAGTDYTVAGNVVTLQKAYLAGLANGTATLAFKFSAGADQSLSMTITDTTPLDSQISPTTAAFDKKVSAQADVPVTLTLNGNTFSGVWNGAAALTAGTDYTVAGNVVTLQKAYLASLANGTITLAFRFSAGADQSLSVTITDTTPSNSQISPTTAAFDKKVSAQADVPVTLTLNGNTFSGVWNGASTLAAGTDYTLAGNVVTLQKAYLATLANGTATLVFKFSGGADQSLSVTITDTTPLDSQISPTTAAFDKKVSAQADVPVTLTLNGNTFSGVWNGAAALTAGTDYDVAGNVVTLQKAYLATLANGSATLVFKFSAGADQSLSVTITDTTPLDSQISPTTAAFDKKVSAQADVPVTLTLNGNTFSGVWNGAAALIAGTDYTVAGNVVTLQKAYLASLANGSVTLVFKFSAGADQSLSVTITDTTPSDSQISPTTAAFDKKVSAQADVPVTLTLNGNTFSGVWNGSAALTAGTDYTVAGNVVTLQKAYLANLANGSVTLVFKFSAGVDQSLSVTITDTTPLDSQISPTTAAFDKKVSAQADVPVTLTLNGNTFSGVWNGAASLTAGTDYTVAGNVVTLQKAYLASLANGTATLVFKFSAGADQSLSMTITDTTPLDSQISPTTAAFDKKVSAQADVPVTLTLNGNTFSGVWNGSASLTAGTDYTVAGNVVTLQKAYLATLGNGSATLVFKFSAGADQSLSVTITDTTPSDSQISPTTAAFDKKVSAQADVPVTLTLNGNTFSGVWNGAAALTAGTDYDVAGNVVTLQKAYLASLANGTATLVFKFSAGLDQSLSVTITDTTPLDSQISPTTAAFDKKVSAQADVPVTLTLNGNTFSGVWNGAASLTAGTDYTVAGNVVTLQKAYLASLANGSVTLVFKFSAGADQSLSVTITDTTTSLDSQLSPTIAFFDKKPNMQTDVRVTLTLNGHTLTNIRQGPVVLTAGVDYIVAGNVVMLQKTYLASLPIGAITLTFSFSGGADQRFTLRISNTSFAVVPSFPQLLEPASLITVPVTGYVESGKPGEAVGTITITRTTDPNGAIHDQYVLTPDQLEDVLPLLLTAGQSTVRIVIPDVKDEVSLTDVIIPAAVIQLLSKSQMDLEICTENVIVRVPHTSLSGVKDDVYFRLVPIKEEQRRRELERRARAEQSVILLAQGKEVEIIARPMTIETNLQNHRVTLILPVRDVRLPTDAGERADFLAKLPVYIEHSDGEKRVEQPRVVDYRPGLYGLQFDVNKFSTFAILNMKQYHSAYMQGFADGTFRPEQTTTRAEIAAILARILGGQDKEAGVPSYPDVPSTHWAFSMIEFVKRTGLMIGDENGNFRPDVPLTRGEMAVIAARLKQLASPVPEQSSFVDVAASHWASPAIEAAHRAQIVDGYPDGTYKPNGQLTRAEAVAIVNRLLNRGPLYGVFSPHWPDVPASHWAYGQIEEASENHDYTARLEGGESIVD